MSMTDKEVVEGAERMARALLSASGYSAVDSVDEDAEPVPPPVVLDSRHQAALMKSKIGACTCMTKTPEARFHHENCLYRQLCEIEQVLLAR